VYICGNLTQKKMDLTIENASKGYNSLMMAKVTGKNHQHIMRDIRDEIDSLGEVIGLSIFGHTSYLDNQNRPQPMFLMEKKGWLQMGARYDAKIRYAIIDYVDKLESITPNTFSDALYLAAEQQKTIEALQSVTVDQKLIIEHRDTTIAQNKSRVAFANAVAGTKNTILIRQFAKMLSDNGFEIGQNRLFEWFRRNKYLMWNNEPYQQYVKQGLFLVDPRVVGDADRLITVKTTRLTGKGQTYFAEKIINK